MRVDLTLFSELMSVVVLYYLALFVVGARGVRVPKHREGARPLVVIVVPAHNEELVIENTVASALTASYDGPVRVLVMDDASTDRTGEIVTEMAGRDQRLRVIRRSAEIGGRGKSEVLNHAFNALCHLHDSGDPWLGARGKDQILLCIVDADGRLSPTALNDASAFFGRDEVGAVQVGVQIRNAKQSLLARMQDMEFVGFSFMVQTARDRLGSVGLGGNGQFTRMSAVVTLGDRPWSPGALTEDLDLGIRMMMAGWRLRFCSTAWVDQQGLASPRALLRQRTRWAQGHYQCWRHIPKVARSRRLTLVNRFDTLAYLVLICMVMLVSAAMIVRALAFFGLVTATNTFLPWLGDGFAFRGVVLILSWMPIVLTLVTYQRFAVGRLRYWEWPFYGVVFAVYVYLWALATARAWLRMALRKGNWVKTPRIAGAELGVGAR